MLVLKKICATCFKQKLQICNLCPIVFFGLLGLSTFHVDFAVSHEYFLYVYTRKKLD